MIRDKLTNCAGRAAVLFTVILGGCSLIEPHPQWSRFQSDAGTRTINDMSLSDAMSYAQRGIDEYRSYLNDDARITTVLGLGVIPLAGAGVGLGAVGLSTEAIALATASGTGFAAGQWLNADGKRRAYVAGIAAITCAMRAVAPLNLSDGQVSLLNRAVGADSHRTTPSLSDLSGSVRNLRDQVAGLENLKGNLEDQKAEEVKRADQLLERTNLAIEQAMRLLAQGAGAGRELALAVERIRGEVDQLLTDAQPDFDDLKDIVGGIGGFLSVGGDADGEQTPETESVAELVKSLAGMVAAIEGSGSAGTKPESLIKALMVANDTLEKALVPVEELVGGTLAALEERSLEDCTALVGPQRTLAVKPAGSVKLDAGASERRFFAGGEAPYSAAFVEQNIPGLATKVNNDELWVEVSTSEKTPGGNYRLQIADKNRVQRFLKVEVLAKKKPAPKTTAQICQEVASKGIVVEERTLGEARIKLLQTLLGVVADGDIGTTTRQAVGVFQEANKLSVTCRLTPDVAKAIFAAGLG